MVVNSPGFVGGLCVCEDGALPSSRRYSAEVRERAVRLYFDHRGEFSSDWAAMRSIGEKLGIAAETLRLWVRRVEVDQGQRPGVTTDERERLGVLERENRELRRANAILRDASVFFATELDGRPRR